MAALWTTLVVLLCTTAVLCDPLPPPGQCVNGTYPPKESRRVPKYIINLDQPPEQRWTQLVSENKEQLSELIEVIRNFSRLIVGGDRLIELVDDYLPYLLDTLPEPFVSELHGIANATGIPVGEITLYNIFYEIFTVCTSIVAQDSQGGLYHARNLDFGLFLGWDIRNHTWRVTEALRPNVVQLDFQRNGKTVFTSASFVGYVGMLTAIKPKRFTLTIDERFSTNGGFIGIIEWIIGKHSGKWMGFLMREVMENATSYDEAFNTLSKSVLLAPAYYILGGNTSEQACIITKDRGTTDANIWKMDDSGNEWFLVETNYDHWKKPPFFDDRRTPAIKCMNQMGQQNISFAGLFNVLSTQPNLNKLTTYTSLMKVESGEMETYLQYCPDPCYPF